MAKYLVIVQGELARFSRVDITHILRDANLHADTLAQLATSRDGSLHKIIPIETMSRPSIDVDTDPDMMQIDVAPCWMDEIHSYITEGTLPTDKTSARAIIYRVRWYTIHNGVFYRRGMSLPLLHCLRPDEAEVVVQQTHDGICGNHSAGRSLADRILRQGYYWPNLSKDADDYSKKCDKCQRYAPVTHAPPTDLHVIVKPVPFARRGIDFIGALPTGRGGYKYAIVAIYYFTKWIEAKPLKVIDTSQTCLFVEKEIIHRFGIPHQIITAHGLQFDSAEFTNFLTDFGIRHSMTSIAYPQSNGQVEAINKTLKINIRRRLNSAKGRWVDGLSETL